MRKWLTILVGISLVVGSSAKGASSIDITQPVQGVPYSAAPIRQNFEDAANDINALQSLNAGTSAPSSPALGNLWLDTSTTPYVLKIRSSAGSQWVPLAAFDNSAAQWIPPVGGGAIPSIISAATTNLGSVNQSAVNITGNQSIASFGTVPEGQVKFLTFTGAPTLVYNASFMILPGGTNLTLSAGQTAVAVSLGGGAWRVSPVGMSLSNAMAFPNPVSALTNAVQINVGGYPAAAQIPLEVFQGLSVMVKVPSSFTAQPWPATAISAYILGGGSGGVNATVVPFFSFGGMTTDNGSPGGAGAVWGANFVANNCASLDCAPGTGFDAGITGLELNVNVVDKGANPASSQVRGLIIAGGGPGQQPVHGSLAIDIATLSLNAPWLYGLNFRDGAVTNALQIGKAAASGDANSQVANWNMTTGGVDKAMSMYFDQNGFFQFLGAPDTGGVTALNFNARNAYLVNGTNALTSLAGANTTVYGDLGTAALIASNTLASNSYRNTTHSLESIGGATVFATVNVNGLRLIAYTVGTLPACAAGTKGYLARVTDANAPAYDTNVAGGGAVDILVRCDGTNWKT